MFEAKFPVSSKLHRLPVPSIRTQEVSDCWGSSDTTVVWWISKQVPNFSASWDADDAGYSMGSHFLGKWAWNKKDSNLRIYAKKNLWIAKMRITATCGFPSSSSKVSDNRTFITIVIDQIFSQQPTVSQSEIGSKMVWCKIKTSTPSLSSALQSDPWKESSLPPLGSWGKGVCPHLLLARDVRMHVIGRHHQQLASVHRQPIFHDL